MVKKKENKPSAPTKTKKIAKEINLVDLVVKGMLELKAKEITIIDLRNIKSAVANYFIICSANTDTQLDAIRQSIEEEVWKATGQNVWMKEGIQNKEWILLDYADVVAHIFRTDRREFYGLEDLWGDADITVLDDDTAEATKKPKKITKPKAEKKEEKPKAKATIKKAAKTTTKAVKPKAEKKEAKPKPKTTIKKATKTTTKKTTTPKKKSSK